MASNLSQTVVQATGLPQDPMEREFNALLAKHGKDANELTLDELREVMIDYLQTVFLEIYEEKDLSA